MVSQVATSFFDKDVPDVALRSLFQKYDKDQSGYLSRDQIREFLENDLGLTKEQAEAYAMMIDEDANKAISYEELVNWLRSGEKFKHINDKTKYVLILLFFLNFLPGPAWTLIIVIWRTGSTHLKYKFTTGDGLFVLILSKTDLTQAWGFTNIFTVLCSSSLKSTS